MIRKIIHRIWNERKQNAWLFLELFVVSLFVWLATDPLIDLASRNSINPNYDDSRVYKLEMRRYYPTSPKYRAEYNNDSIVNNGYIQILNIIENLPEVENYSLTEGAIFYYAVRHDEFIVDSTQTADGKSIKKNIFYYYDYTTKECNSFETFRMNIHTGDSPSSSDTHGVYISRSLAQELYGTENVIGKSIYRPILQQNLPILGTIDDIQPKMYEEPIPIMVIKSRFQLKGGIQRFLQQIDLDIRIKRGVNAAAFEKRFTDEILPKLKAGNLYANKLHSLKSAKEKDRESYGINNLYKQSYILSFFALLCGFMGIFGTFWLRAIARRRDIGIMQSIGATRKAIIRQFATEAVVLSSIAFAIALPLIMHKVYVSGFSCPLEYYLNFRKYEGTEYLHNQPLPRFLLVTIISYIFMVIISIVGAVVPTAATIKRHPADALRE